MHNASNSRRWSLQTKQISWIFQPCTCNTCKGEAVVSLVRRSTQPGHPFMGRRNEYQPKSGDVLRLGRKAGMVRAWVAGKTVWSLVTRGPYLSALEMRSLYIKRYINSPSLLYFFTLPPLAMPMKCSLERESWTVTQKTQHRLEVFYKLQNTVRSATRHFPLLQSVNGTGCRVETRAFSAIFERHVAVVKLGWFKHSLLSRLLIG